MTNTNPVFRTPSSPAKHLLTNNPPYHIVADTVGGPCDGGGGGSRNLLEPLCT